MKTILTNIVILFLISSCQCMRIKNDVRRVWSFKFNKCLCQTYSFLEIKSLDKAILCEDYFAPIIEQYVSQCKGKKFRKNNPEKCQLFSNDQYCEDLVGFSKESWAKNLTPYGRESKACYEDNCKNLKKVEDVKIMK